MDLVPSGKQTWAVLFSIVIAHEAFCRENELLSEEVDRQLEQRHTFTWLFGLVTFLHLYNLLPNQVDPYHWLARLGDQLKRKATNG